MIPNIPDEQQRLAALKSYQILDTPAEEGFDRITRIVSASLDVPIALVSLIDDSRQWFKSCFGIDAQETSKEIAFCAHAIASPEPFIIYDAREDERFKNNPLVTGEPNIRFYAGIPLKTHDGQLIGTLCAIDTKPRTISEDQVKIIQDLAGLVMDEMDLRLANMQSQLDLKNKHQILNDLADSKEVLAAILDNTVDGMITINEMGLLETFNKAAENLFGYSPQEVIGRNVKILMPAPYFSEHDGYLEQYKNSGHKKIIGIGREVEGKRKDGSIFPMELAVADIQLSGRRFFAGIVRDISERKQIEQQLVTAASQAEQANRAKSDFLSRMSHELRTPLNVIVGFAQLLELEEPDESTRENIAYILKAGHHLTDLINEVLDIARIEAGYQNFSIEPIQISSLLSECWKLIIPLANERGITLADTELLASEHYVSADLQRLKQVILNLFSNAVKYNKSQGTISIRCSLIEESHIRVMVTNQGEGIDPEDFERVFEPFERLNADTLSIQGTGMGLSLCKTLIEAMNGQLGVNSILGQSATFWFELPVAEGSSVEVNHATQSSEKHFSSPTKTATILCIEDNITNLHLIESAISRLAKLNLISAMQGRLGLELAQKHLPDIIFLDINLPDINGDEVLKQLQSNVETAHIPVVVISADATQNQIDNLLGLGAYAYLTKPFYIKELQATITELLNKS